MPTGSLDAYFTQLSLIEDGTDKVARALVWGDSTIASDEIIKDVRGRMQERFGDAGPGFLAAKVDKRWAFRRDIVRKTEGKLVGKEHRSRWRNGFTLWIGRDSFHRSSRSKIYVGGCQNRW